MNKPTSGSVCSEIMLALVLSLLLAVANTVPAYATELHAFNIDDSNASAAVRAFGRQAGLEIMASADVLDGRRLNRVSGNYSTDQAIQVLLEGSGLTHRYIGERGVVLVALKSAAAQSGTPDSAQDGEPTSDGAPGSVQEVVVHAVRFHEDDLGTALKVPLSVKDTPQTELSITGDVMEFASIKEFQDVSKVDATGGTTHRVDGFPTLYFRGFRQQSSNAIRVDGFRLAANFDLDFAPVERIEIVKGATSTMYGQNSVAGTMNVISKMPRKEFGGEIKVEAGSFSHYRVDADFYGPITADGALAYRVVAARLDEHEYLDYAQRTSTVFAPTIRYEFSPDTSIYARINYQKITAPPMWGVGLQYLGDMAQADATGYDPKLIVVPNLPRSFYSGASWDNQQSYTMLTQSSLTHRFGNGWVLRINAQQAKLHYLTDRESVGLLGADGVPQSVAPIRDEVHSQLGAGEVNLYGDVDLFGHPQTLFIGADYSSMTSPEFYTEADSAPYSNSLSVFDPSFNTGFVRPTTLSQYDFFYDAKTNQVNAGVTLQAFIRPIDGLTLLLGGRYSHDKNSSRTRCCDTTVVDGTAPFDVLEVRSNSFTSQTGVTYALTPDLNVYGSFGQTYEPQTTLQAPDKFADPERGTAREIGLKGTRGRQLGYSLALFDMRRSNISQPRPDSPYVDTIGTQRSRGVEAELQGTLLPGWEFFGSIGLMQAQYIAGQYSGYQPENAPRFGLSAFTSYEIQEGPLHGVGVGAGVVTKRGRTTFFNQLGTDGKPITYDFHDYTEVDLRLFKDWNQWHFQLAATNLLDTRYYTPALNNFGFGVHVNPPRTLTGQAAYRFSVK